MKMNLKQITGTLVLGAGLALISGCSSIKGGTTTAGAPVYVAGDLKGNLDAPIAECDASFNQAINDLHFYKVSEKNDVATIKIQARDQKDRMVTVHLRKLTDEATSVSIRVGTLGDKPVSQELFGHFNKILAERRAEHPAAKM